MRVALDRDTDPIAYADVIDGWHRDVGFCSWFNSVLASAPFDAFRWETPAVSTSTATQSFEFVLLDAPDLARRPEPDAFEDQFRHNPDADILTFPNLGGDAMMVVPCPIGPISAYAHLAAFVRTGPPTQQVSLWRAVADAMRRRLGSNPVWLSTAGGGVSWLHVRLDDGPKYYGYAPYRNLK